MSKHLILSGNIGLTLAALRKEGIGISRCRLRGSNNGITTVVKPIHLSHTVQRDQWDDIRIMHDARQATQS